MAATRFSRCKRLRANFVIAGESGRFGNRVELFRETLHDWIRTQSNVTSRLVDDFRTELEQSGIDLYHGYGQFRDERPIRLPIQALRSRQSSPTIVATGSQATFENNSAPRLANSDQLLQIEPLPDRLVIISLDSTAFSQASIAIESILGRQSRFDPFENSPLHSY